MTWVVIVAVGLGSFAFRLGPQLLLERVTPPDSADRLIRHAGTAALTALIVTATKQNATGNALVPTLLAVGVATVLVARGGSMLRLLACGGGVYAVAMVTVGLLS